MRVGWIRIAAVVLMSAAPAGAALPEDAVTACRALTSELVYIGQVGEPFQYRLFHEKIDHAREVWLKARAALDKSPDDVGLLISAIDAEMELKDWTISSAEITVVPVRIERVFRGNPGANSFIMILPGMKVEPGRSYVFYGQNRFALFDLDAHYGSAHEVRIMTNGLRVLEASLSAGGGMIYGALELEHANNRGRATPLAGTRIRLTASEYVEDVITDADGMFIGSNIPDGPVTITPILPEQFGVIDRAVLTSHVTAGHCASVDLRAALNGRIRGKVFGRDGNPRTGLPLEIFARERGWLGETDNRYKVITNERGEFEFHALPPGSYILGHQIISPHLVMPSEKLPPKTFYPGTPDRSAAIPIVVGTATQHDGIDFVVETAEP